MLTPNTILTNSVAPIRVTFSLGVGVAVGPAGVRLATVDSDNVVQAEIATLLDNGLLANGDEILGDGVYSAMVVVSEGSPTDVRLQVLVDIDGVDEARSETAVLSIHAPTSQIDDDTQAAVQADAAQDLKDMLDGGTDLSTAINQVVEALTGLAGVKSATKEGSTSVVIEFDSGLFGGLFLNQVAAGSKTRGGAFTATSASTGTARWSASVAPLPADTIDRAKAPRIPVAAQTVGANLHTGFASFGAVGELPPDQILNRDVPIYAPYEAVWTPFNEGPGLVQLLTDSPLGFQITYLQDQAADVAALQNLTQYGLIVLATHGSQGEWFLTGEVATAAAKTQYDAQRQDGQLGVFTNVEIGENGRTATVQDDVFGVSSGFISALPGMFPQNLIVNNSCESTLGPNLANAFLARGAETYLGYSQVVTSGFAVDRVLELVEAMVTEAPSTPGLGLIPGDASLAAGLAQGGFATAGEAFIPGQVDPPHMAEWQLVGNMDLHYSDGFINGDFEFGDLSGWTRIGDGRVITQLAFIEPPEGDFMGIISTGLGFTVNSGEIRQTFRMPANATTLELYWNFLSEEFLEFIDSQFQDFFQVSIIPENGPEDVLYLKTIDQIAAACMATTAAPGLLVSVSPAIVFDIGGVYMTDWQHLTLPVAPYQGQLVTLRLSAGDVGDSIYDTAILLDMIEFN